MSAFFCGQRVVDIRDRGHVYAGTVTGTGTEVVTGAPEVRVHWHSLAGKPWAGAGNCWEPVGRIVPIPEGMEWDYQRQGFVVAAGVC